VKARIPLDLELDDQLLFGLSPQRTGYALIALLASLTVWKSGLQLAPRLLLDVLVLVAGGTLSWGRWQGRPADHWLIDLFCFVRLNYRFETVRIRPRPILLLIQVCGWGRSALVRGLNRFSGLRTRVQRPRKSRLHLKRG